jgi:hypothetical protein
MGRQERQARRLGGPDGQDHRHHHSPPDHRGAHWPPAGSSRGHARGSSPRGVGAGQGADQGAGVSPATA